MASDDRLLQLRKQQRLINGDKGSDPVAGQLDLFGMVGKPLPTSSYAGVDIEAIADAAGHINSNVTRTVYRHQIADKVSAAANTMDDIFGQVSGS